MSVAIGVANRDLCRYSKSTTHYQLNSVAVKESKKGSVRKRPETQVVRNKTFRESHATGRLYTLARLRKSDEEVARVYEINVTMNCN